jgi:hypothetical protein
MDLVNLKIGKDEFHLKWNGKDELINYFHGNIEVKISEGYNCGDGSSKE